MLSEVFLIFFVLILWLSAIGFCLNQYKSVRRLETQVHYCVNRKDPLNIGNIKIVEREQDSIIYKKKRYSTVPDTHINHDELKAMQYVKEYLLKNTPKSSVTDIAACSRENLTGNLVSSTTTTFLPSSKAPLMPAAYIPLSTHNEQAEEHLSSTISPASLEPFTLIETDTDKFTEQTHVADPKGKIIFVDMSKYQRRKS